MILNNLSVESLFNRISDLYDHPIPQSLFYGRMHKAMLEALEDQYPREVLDAGCGTGEFIQQCSLIWPEAKLIGLDLSENMLAQAEVKSYGINVPRFIEGNVYDIELEDDSIDLVTNSISSHFYTDINKALSEFYRVLRPSGTLAMANITNGILSGVPSPFKKGVRLPSQTYRSSENWIDHLTDCGFNVLDVQKLQYPVELFICQK